MSDTVWQTIIAAIVTCVLAYMQQRTKRSVDEGNVSAVNAATLAANKADQVKNDLAGNTETTEQLLRVASATKILVNSGMAAQLEAHARTARRLADLTKSAEDVRLAEAAEKALADHYVKHCVADHCPFTQEQKS